ncbi:MAG: cation:proton antiporter, partial [Spirulinaceae cyanobacterium]
ILKLIPNSPIVGFTILLLVILTVPPVFEKLRLPGLVGLLVAGVCLGPSGLGLLNAESETMKLLSDIGKIYLMFVAGLEIDLEDFRKTKNRSLCFGIATFLIPLIFGTFVGQLFGLSFNASILVGSLLASHTLLGYPIVNRLGVANNEAVTVTIGATIFTDIAALLVLAICISIHGGDFSTTSLVMQLGALAIYSVIVLFGFDWAGKEYFRRTGEDESNQFLFVLLAVFLAAVGAQLIQVDKIVGAFLAGLAVNDVVGRSPVEEKVEFVGSTLFIPFFFVGMGLLLDVAGLVDSLTSNLVMTLAIVGALISSKFLAALVTKVLYHYSWDETLTMWSLSLPQVAATLAAALAAKEAGLIEDSVFNIVIVLMLVTSILGPVITAKYARKISPPKAPLQTEYESWGTTKTSLSVQLEEDSLFTVLVPVYNPHTERNLIEMGALLARRESGIIVPLSVAKARVTMDEPELNAILKQSKKLLQRSLEVSKEFGVEAKPAIRIDEDTAQGISRAAREQDADIIIMGWSPTRSLQARLFGNLIDNVFWAAHCPVAVMHLLEEPIDIHSVLVPIKNLTPQALHIVKFAQLFADTNQAKITLLHICDRKTPQQQVDEFESELSKILTSNQFEVDLVIETLRRDDVAKAIIKATHSYDLVILRSIRRRTAGGLAVSDITTKIIPKLTCSMILFGEPH